MNNLLNRMTPLVQPFVQLRDGHCAGLLREGTKDGKVVLVSSCGYWETDNIDLLLAQAKALRGFAGAVLRPHGGRLKTYDGDEHAG